MQVSNVGIYLDHVCQFMLLKLLPFYAPGGLDLGYMNRIVVVNPHHDWDAVILIGILSSPSMINIDFSAGRNKIL